ncbi:hypothetical protein KCTCHS21_44240 [Cohnella abietis]|uniref:Glycosyltransferase 2-like domain-containing protein n=1 Tax=Cohnella abietis TaxID=2507935 RepID=A0A3T1DAB6_9BACL|nr:hypothetical protein KCTCHS21_44240 [Cohnella abietis]
MEALPLHEIVIVLANTNEEIYSLARNHKNMIIAYLPDEVNPDVGRALGAKLTGADTVLFVDGEHPVHSDILARFLWECDGRVDIALNDLTAQMGLFNRRGESERFHEFLNRSLNREDLSINCLSSLPFAVSRNALDTLGAAAFTVPIKAHALAILNGLKIGTGGSASNRNSNRLIASKQNWQIAAGDHVEAWTEAMGTRGSRLDFTDSVRNRSVLGDWEQ